MKKPTTFILAASLALFSSSCSESTSKEGTHEHADGTVHKNDDHADHVHDLMCGCAIKEVGKCGEFIKVDDKFIPLTLPASADLGPMPFCRKEGLKADVEGAVKDGKYVATSFAYVTKDKK